MIKQYSISTILLVAFLIGLAHNVIPHHHHDSIEEIKYHHHSHQHDSKSAHHHEHEQEHDHEEPLGFFSHLTHFYALTNADFVFVIDKLAKATSSVFLVNDTGIKVFSQNEIHFTLILEAQTRAYTSILLERDKYSKLALRGPPSYLFV